MRSVDIVQAFIRALRIILDGTRPEETIDLLFSPCRFTGCRLYLRDDNDKRMVFYDFTK